MQLFKALFYAVNSAKIAKDIKDGGSSNTADDLLSVLGYFLFFGGGFCLVIYGFYKFFQYLRL